MVLLYNVGIQIYYFLIRASSVFNPKAKKWIEGRKSQELIPFSNNREPVIWFHCSSLGEFEQGRPLIELIKKNNSGVRILLTFFSPSGYEIRKNYNFADKVLYLPLDTKKNATRFLSVFKPDAIVFVKYDFWYHFINEASKSEIPLFLISSVFRKHQAFFRWYGAWYRKILFRFSRIFVQDVESLNLIEKIGVDNATIVGDTRIDRVFEISQNPLNIPEVVSFSAASNVIICGSTWEPDEKLICEYINTTDENAKFIIAPHNISETHISAIKEKLKVLNVRFSELKNMKTENFRVLLIDNIGMLSSLYQFGRIAYIGGGFGAGIHNILEPAAFGLPIVFGPKFQKFNEAVQLLGSGAGICVRNYSDLKKSFDYLLSNWQDVENKSVVAKQFIVNQIGSSEKIYKAIFQEFNK